MLKKNIKDLVHKIGFELHRLTPGTNPFFQLLKGLDRFGVDLVLDIGANAGQFAQDLRSMGYKKQIVSFDPLSDAYRALTAASARDAKWTVHQRGAIGDYDGEIEINISGNSVSSSVLPMLDAHSTASLDSAYIGSEKVSIFKLDSVASNYTKSVHRYFLKIDTQGYEAKVLDGATETLKNAQGVLCELSLVPLYEGQLLWLDLIERLERMGFTLWAIQPGFSDPRDGRTLQVDAIFFRLEDK